MNNLTYCDVKTDVKFKMCTPSCPYFTEDYGYVENFSLSEFCLKSKEKFH